MTRKATSLLFTAVLVGSIVLGSALDSYSGTESEKPMETGTQQPTTYQPFKDSLRWRAGLEVIADLRVNPENHSGECPGSFTFKGSIFSNKAMTVQYRFIRSDNVRTDPKPLALKKDEKKEVAYAWQLGDPAGPLEFREWVLLQVIYPTNMKAQSNVVLVKGNCTNHAGTRLQVPSGLQKSAVSGIAPGGMPPVAVPGQKGPMPPELLAPAPQNGQGPDGLPMPETGQRGPGSMPVIQPGPKGPLPGMSPMLPGNGKEGPPGSMPVPQPDDKGLQGTDKREDP